MNVYVLSYGRVSAAYLIDTNTGCFAKTDHVDDCGAKLR